MSLYHDCVSILCTKGIMSAEIEESGISFPSTAIELRHTTVPTLLSKEKYPPKTLDVYYISDLHLVHHLMNQFPHFASDDDNIMLRAPAVYRQAAAAAIRYTLAPRQKVLLPTDTLDRHIVHDLLPPQFMMFCGTSCESRRPPECYATFVQRFPFALYESLHSLSYSEALYNPPVYLTFTSKIGRDSQQNRGVFPKRAIQRFWRTETG